MGASDAAQASAADAEESLFARPPARRSRSRRACGRGLLDEFVGQEHLLAPGKPLREAIERGVPGSMIFWGPPGSGEDHAGATSSPRTTAARVRAVQRGDRRRAADPRDRRGRASAARLGRRQTILFVDEIHRLNKAQQDSLLPPSEDGTITLIGATTENPSFEINGALLSRTRVFVLAAARAEGRR